MSVYINGKKVVPFKCMEFEDEIPPTDLSPSPEER